MWMSVFNQIDPQSILLQNSSIQTDTTAGASVAQIFLSRAMGGFQAENHDHCLHSGMFTVCKRKNFSDITQKFSKIKTATRIGQNVCFLMFS